MQAHGGTDAADAATADKAERWFNSPASAGAGSGPYELASYEPTSQVTLRANPNYWGARKPAFGSRRDPEHARCRRSSSTSGAAPTRSPIDLSSDQARDAGGRPRACTCRSNPRRGSSTCSRTTTRRSRRSRRTGGSSRPFATRSTTRGSSPSRGRGAIQAPGIIPSMILGALPQRTRSGRTSRRPRPTSPPPASEVEQVTLEYPSDLTINGVPFATLAQKVQASLQRGRIRRRAGRVAGDDVPAEVPCREGGLRPLALGARLPRSRRLPRVHAGQPHRAARRLAGGQRSGAREARRPRHESRRRRQRERASTGRSSSG